MTYIIGIKSLEYPFIFFECEAVDSSTSGNSVMLTCKGLEKEYYFIEAQNKEMNTYVHELKTDLNESVGLIKRIISAKCDNDKYISEGDAIQFAERISGKRWGDL